MTVTLAYNSDLSRVQISVDGLAERRAARVERSLNQLLWSTVRGGLAVPVAAGEISLDDYEFISDQQNFYRVTPLDFVAGFEVDVAGWEAFGGTSTFAHSTAQANSGTGSGLLTPDGVTATVRARSAAGNRPPVTGGTTYDLSVWVYRDAVGSRDVDISVAYLDDLETSLDFAIWQTVTVPAATWTRIAGSRVAPEGATQAQLHVNQRDTPAATDLLHVDDVEFTPIEYTGEAQTASITPTLGGQIWLKSIRYPFLNRPIVVTDFSDVSRASRSGVFEVKGRSVPVVASDVRGSQQFLVEVKTETLVEARDMDLTLASGSQFFLHVPAGCPVPGGYVDIGDTSQARRLRSARSERRYVSLPCRVVAAPGPDVVGGTMTWGAVLALYGDSWPNLLAANPTWVDLFALVASPDDLVAL